MPTSPTIWLLELLRAMRAEVSDIRGDMAIGFRDIRSEIASLRADVAADLIALRTENDAEHKKTREQVVGLGRAVVEYHSAVIGHGMLISDLEARVRRSNSI